MYAFFVSGKATTASFRVPETHTYHQTLPLPPKTTVIGMMGAALGLVLQDAHAYSRTHGIQIGVYGSHKGLMRDLWNYRKVTGKEKSYTPIDIKNRRHYSILIREYLTDCDFTFFFGAASKESLADIRDAMARPVYALTAGNSDDLLKIAAISPIQEVNEEPITQFDHTILPGDVSAECQPAIDFRTLPVTQTVDTPQVFLLPTQFAFNGNRRTVVERMPFTFVGSPVTLTAPVPGYVFGGKHIVML
ncbi:MAG: CRISPR-associated protein Cas5 [Methanolinea sp.]|jgi:CRISPR-associated protein Cas5t